MHSKASSLTVLLPVYNGERFLKEAIESILGQTYKDFELLIIDDCSKDGSAALIESFNDPRIRFLHNANNLGLIGTLNRGLEEAKGAFVARMDQDDIAAPERLEKQLALMSGDLQLLAAGTAMVLLSAQGEQVGALPVLVGHEALKRALTVVNPFAHSSMILRKEAALQVGGYHKDAYATEDYDLWTRLAAAGHVANLEEPLLRYRLNPEGMSISGRNTQKKRAAAIADAQWRLYGEEGPAPLVDWPKIWPHALRKTLTANQRLPYATLHVLFAKGYRRRGKWGLALRHFLAAFKWSAANRAAYVALLMFVMPYRLYGRLEERLSLILNNVRAGRAA